MDTDSRQVSANLNLEEIAQLEEVLFRHRRTPVIIGLQEKMRKARRVIDETRHSE